MNRKERRRQKKNKGLERKRQRNVSERQSLKRKTDYALRLCLGCTLMTMRDLYPEFKLSKDFFERMNENIQQVTMDSHDLEELFRVIEEEYSFDIRRI